MISYLNDEPDIVLLLLTSHSVVRAATCNGDSFAPNPTSAFGADQPLVFVRVHTSEREVVGKKLVQV